MPETASTLHDASCSKSIVSSTLEGDSVEKRCENREKAGVCKKSKDVRDSNGRFDSSPYPYGNYRNYYSFRGVVDRDQRLDVLLPHLGLKHRRSVLDIGCCSGQVTHQVWDLVSDAAPAPGTVLGIDIDSDLIDDAVAAGGSRMAPGDVMPVGELSFMTANIADPDVALPGTFDVILLFSVSKWIHVNFGDDGLRRTFKKIADMLAPDGIFVIEPQTWKQYKRLFHDTHKEHKRAIKLKPDQFPAHLKTLGLDEIAHIQPTDGSQFKRDIFVFTKHA